MKKIVLSTIAATALLFGITSCSGDLHENAIQPLCITGLCGTEVVPMNLDSADGSEQSLTFTVKEDFVIKGLDGKDKALKDGWGKLTSIQFKIVPSTELKENREPNWKVDWGGATDSGNIFVKPGADEYTALLMRGDPGTTAAGPSNVQIDGAVMNEEYTIRVKYSGNKVSVKIDGLSEDPTEMKINIVGDSTNFPAKDKNGKDLTYKMSKAAKVYTYQFISVADETLEFKLSNPMYGTFYASSTKDGELELESAGKKNLSYDVKKDVEYKITVDLSSVLKPTIKAEIVDMLKDAKINANWIYADNSYTEKIEKDAYQFIARREEIDFTVVRHDGSVWGQDTAASVGIDSDSVSLKFNSEKTETVKTVKVKNLKVGSCYKFILEKDNDAFTLSAKVILVPLADYSGSDLVGDMGNDGIAFTKDSNGNYYVDFTYLNSWTGWAGGNGKLVFAIRFVAGDWGGGQTKYAYFTDASLPEGYKYIENSGNPAITGMIDGQKYRITFIPGYGDAKLKLELK